MSSTQYRLGRLLGAGGMAEVYLGHATGTDGFVLPVAIKRIRDAHAIDPAFVDAFAGEARLAVRLTHPNIVRVLDFQRDARNVPFIVMEYVRGRDLSALLRKGALPCSTAVYVFAEVLRGLAYAHDLPTSSGLRGIVHRDVSPHNVLVSWNGEVKVSDFGIAKAYSTSHLAHSATLKGKPGYMSPEQINAEPLDGRSDLFAAGVVFWEMLAGKPLFTASTYSETLVQVLRRPIPRPSEVAPREVPKDVEAVVFRLLERDRGARYATAQEAISDLLACEIAPRNGVMELVELMTKRFGKPRSETPIEVPSVVSGMSGDAPPQSVAMTAPALTPLSVPTAEAERQTREMAPRVTGPHDATLVAASAPATPSWQALTQRSGSEPQLEDLPAAQTQGRRRARGRLWAGAAGAALLAGVAATAWLVRSGATTAPTAVPPAATPAAAAAPSSPDSASAAAPTAPAPPSAPAAQLPLPPNPAPSSPGTGGHGAGEQEAPGAAEQPGKLGTPERRKRTQRARPAPEVDRPERIVDVKLDGS